MKPTVTLITAAALAGGLLVGCGGDDGSDEGDGGRAAVTIISPKPDDLVTAHTLTARVRADGPRFRVVLDGRDVTKRFRAGAGGVRSATFRRGPDFGLGRDAITAQIGDSGSRTTDGAVFRAARRDDGRIELSKGSEQAAVPLRVRSSHEIVERRVWVNGRSVQEPARDHRDNHGFSAGLGARHGLRFGANRVTTEVVHSDGVVSRATRTFRVGHDRPLTEAGPDRHAAVGLAVTLDGSQTKAPSDGDRMRYRWRIVSAPEDSKAELAAQTARTSFKPDVPGHYRLELQAAAATTAVDEVAVDARPTDDPMGDPIQTITKDQGIQVGTQPYPKKGGWVHLLVLDPTTLQPTHGGDQGFDLKDAAKLATAITNAGNDDLVVLSGQGIGQRGGTPFATNAKALEQAFASLGGTTDKRGPTFSGGESFSDGQWSLIGTKHTAGGEAWQSYQVSQAGIPGFQGGDAGRSGTVNGYLQAVGTIGHELVSPEQVTLDTNADDSSATKNMIAVGSKSYASDALDQGGQGFQLLTLDSSDLSLISNETFKTRSAGGKLAPDGMTALAARLDGLVSDPKASPTDGGRYRPPLVVLQSFDTAAYGQGRQSIGNQAAWVSDTLPGWGPDHRDENYDFFEWCGGSDATESLKASDGATVASHCAAFPNSVTGMGSKPTVTHSIGLLAGLPARTAAANLGLDRASGHHAAEALTLVGSAHPYNDGQVIVKVGDPGRRMVSTLRRTKQSQWRASAPAPTGDFDTASFWRTAFRPAQPWKLESSTSPDIAAAHKLVIAELWPKDAACKTRNDPCVTDVRDEYPTRVSEDWDANRNELDDSDPTDVDPNLSDSVKTAYGQLVKALKLDFDHIAQVQNLFKNYETLFRDAQTGGLLDMAKIGGDVKSQALTDKAAFDREQAELDAEAPVGDALYFAADLFEVVGGEVAGPAVGPIALFASAWDLYEDISASNEKTKTEATSPPNYPQIIVDQADRLGADLVTRYQEMNATLDHLLKIFVSDPGKLADAYANAKGNWELSADSTPQKLLIQSIASSAQAAFYSALMPVAYDQLFVSPVQTLTGNRYQKDVVKNPGPRDYGCDDGPNPFEATKTEEVPDASLDYVRWEASGGADENDSNSGHGRNHALGRSLKSKSDPLKTVMNSSETDYSPDSARYVDTAKGHAGSSPPGTLIDKLFKAPSVASVPAQPDGLSMSKDEFFGMDMWTAPRLQCGPSSDGPYSDGSYKKP